MKNRYICLILSFVMIIVSIVGIEKNNSIKTMAYESPIVNLDNIVCSTDIVAKNMQGFDTYNQKIAMASYVNGGTTFNNYARFSGVKISASTEKQSAAFAIDGKTNTRWESDFSDNHSILLDLGNSYSINEIMMSWEDASTSKYSIEVSLDNTAYKKLCDVESNAHERVDDIKLSQSATVRYIRINCMTRNTVYGHSIYELAVFGSEEQKEVIENIGNINVRDYSKYTGKYMVYFDEAKTAKEYAIAIDSMDNEIKRVKTSGQFVTAKELAKLGTGEHKLYVKAYDESGIVFSTAEGKLTVSGNDGKYNDIPQVYINTNVAISGDYHKENDVAITVVDKDGGSYKTIADSACNIKVRGNTTAGAPKKPWNIKFSSKTSVLGMDKGKKWCLLANSFDKSLMRNELAYALGRYVGVTYTSDTRYVDVYVNGAYNGSYLLSEPVEAKKERVDIDAYNPDNLDILLELGTRNESGVDHFNTTVLWTTFDVNDPEKGDDLTDAQVNAKIDNVKNYLNEFESALNSGDYDKILEYMDEDTFVNFYIVNELFKNVDFNFSSTRFYIKDNKVYAGPLWDFDLSSGNCKSSYYTSYYVDGVSYKGYYCQSMNWYKKLIKNKEFYDKVKNRYKDLQYVIQNIYRDDSASAISINKLVESYGQSFARNYLSKNSLGAGWSLTNDDGYSFAAESGWSNWEQPIAFLRNWLKNRNEWLCDQWGVDKESAYLIGKPTTKPETPTTTPSTTTPTTTITTTAASTTTTTTTPATTLTITTTTTTVVKKPGKSAIKKVVLKGKKKVKVTVKKAKYASRYQIMISTSKKFSKRKTVTASSKKITKTLLIKKLKKAKKYYVKVRAYRIADKKKIYGKWSKRKSLIIKKNSI